MVEITDDADVNALIPPRSVHDLMRLFGLLVGEPISSWRLVPEVRSELKGILTAKKTERLSYQQFNELLLLMNQYRVERPFFDFFFLNRDPRSVRSGKQTRESEHVTIADLGNGVRKFRGFAMLCFGNFRFAFRDLSEEEDPRRFMAKLQPWVLDSQDLLTMHGKRHAALLPLAGSRDELKRDETWYVGYLTGDLLDNDTALLACMRGKAASRSLDEVVARVKDERVIKRIKHHWSLVAPEQIERFRGQLDLLGAQAEKLTETVSLVRDRATRNTTKYLTWDYMDVYVATSMREQWEFEETHRFAREVFGQLGDLNLRWFDPTQSYDPNSIDKGLIEGLMLKRAGCTIYMAQEDDTLGKDSELAATLAQGKPVIAYVPSISDEKLRAFSVELQRRPIRFLKQRLLGLLETFFPKADARENFVRKARLLGLKMKSPDVEDEVFTLLNQLRRLESSRAFALLGNEESLLKRQHKPELRRAAQILAAAESVAANNRADMLSLKHPLGMQVVLESGVANGVLVARSAEQCARAIRGILLRNTKFSLDDRVDAGGRVLATVLKETTTNCAFRVVTRNECLTNSFWNFYLDGENGEREGSARAKRRDY